MHMITPDEALGRLMDGNARFANGRMEHPRQDGERRTRLLEGQGPFATILTCSDSRVPPEILFDQGLGDIFVVRVAGNMVDDLALGSIEYAASHLRCPLVMVLGHTDCGAVKAALSDDDHPGHMGPMIAAMRVAVESTRDMDGDPVINTVRENVRLTVEGIATSRPVMADLVREGTTRVMGAVYDMATGTVETVI